MKVERNYDPSDFDEIGIDELKENLGLTIKQDMVNKLITFFGFLSAYTGNNQLNISYRAPSSTGKSYIPLELSALFPKEDVIKYAYSSPTSFYHETGEWDNENKVMRINLERKILIFVDQPHDELLRRLRPLLSHDDKELIYKITDKREKYGIRTKTVIIRGFPSVTFCTGSLKVDEQEATRMILLSPETSQEKIRESLFLKAEKEGNPLNYENWLQQDDRRKLLKARILAIKEENIQEIIVENPEKIAEEFMRRNPKLKPRHTRDLGKLFSLIKVLALVNVWYRQRDLDNNLIANEKDIENAFKLWNEISESQELGIPPYMLRLFNEVIKPAYLDANSQSDEKVGVARKQIAAKHYEVYGTPIQDWLLRQQILPALESAGLIIQEPSPSDKRIILTYIISPPV